MASVIEQTPFNQYIANGLTSVFPYEFELLSQGDLTVVVNGVQSAPTEYSVSGVGAQAGGAVTFLVAPANGVTVLLSRELALERDTDYQVNGDLRADVVDRDFNRLWQALQDQSARVGGALRAPYPEQLTALPDAATRANTVQGYDGAGNPTVLVPASGSAADVLTQLANSSSTALGDALVAVKYATPLTAVALNLHSYIEDDGAYNVMGFIAQANKAAIRNMTSTTDVTTAVQAALDAAYTDNCRGLRFPRGLFNVGALSRTMTGNRLTQGLYVKGAGIGATILKQVGSPARLFDFTSANPAVSHTDAQLYIADLTLQGVGKISVGLSLRGIGAFEAERVLAYGFSTGAALDSSLVGTLRRCILTDNNNGLTTRRSGAAAYSNLIEINGCQVKYNTTFGLDFGSANGIVITGATDIERNGTALNTSTGGVLVRDTCNDETGFCQFLVEGGTWFEANYGVGLEVQSMTDLLVVLRGVKLFSQENGRALRILSARQVTIEDTVSPSTGDTWDITSEVARITNSTVNVLTDTGVTYSVYEGVKTGAADYVSGKTGAFTASLTGCTTVPTGTVTWTRQGKRVTLNITGNIFGTSNTAAAELTGLPAVLWPSATRGIFQPVRDNAVEKLASCSVSAAGVWTLNNGFSGVFTGSGQKGAAAFSITYEQ